MRAALGLDLAGFSAAKSGLALAVRNEDGVSISVVKEHVFLETTKGSKRLPGKQREEFQKLLKSRVPIFADVPIDLQGLPDVSSPTDKDEKPTWVWQLGLRPVDFAFDALPPLSSYLGAVVIRFRWLCDKELTELLGERVCETYPQASFQLLAESGRHCLTELIAPRQAKHSRRIHYKGKYSGNVGRIWSCLRGDAKMLGADEQVQTEHELDAVVCALTGVALDGERLEGHELGTTIAGRISARVATEFPASTGLVPKGYVLIRRLPHISETKRISMEQLMTALAEIPESRR